jgi:dihydrolipoamide dehydrogenase
MNYEVLVIGAAPVVSVAAIRASQLGLKTAFVERAELVAYALTGVHSHQIVTQKCPGFFEYAKHAADYEWLLPVR